MLNLIRLFAVATQKIFLTVVASLLCVAFLLFAGCSKEASKTETSSPLKKVGIVLPIEHTALNAIVEGFQQTLNEHYPGKIQYHLQNAQGDLNLQRAILNQFVTQKMDLVVPVATGTTQMAVQMVKNQPLVSIAASPSVYEQYKNKGKDITGVSDDMDLGLQIDFIHAIYPNLKKFVLIHSSSEKIIPETDSVLKIAERKNIQVQRLMIKDLSELYGITKAIEDDSELIFILKDNLVVSGIRTLAKIAEKKELPLITSDEGSVINGAGFALAVFEKSIGQQAGLLADKVLQGESAHALPIQTIENLSVFYNEEGCLAQGIDIDRLKEISKPLKYTLFQVPPPLK